MASESDSIKVCLYFATICLYCNAYIIKRSAPFLVDSALANIYGSIKYHLVTERTEVAIIRDVDNDIWPHIIPNAKSTSLASTAAILSRPAMVVPGFCKLTS